MFEMSPHPLVGVQFGGVGGKILNIQAWPVTVDQLLDAAGLVGLQIVPDQDQAPPDMPQQVGDENGDLSRCDRSAADQHEEAAIRCHPGDCREFGP